MYIISGISLQCFIIPYSRKIWRGIKFGGLAVYLCNRQIKMRQYFILAYIHVAIPYRTAKFKSANIFAIAIWGPTAKFNSRQYFRLYGSLCLSLYVCKGIIPGKPEQALTKYMKNRKQCHYINVRWDKLKSQFIVTKFSILHAGERSLFRFQTSRETRMAMISPEPRPLIRALERV